MRTRFSILTPLLLFTNTVTAEELRLNQIGEMITPLSLYIKRDTEHGKD